MKLSYKQNIALESLLHSMFNEKDKGFVLSGVAGAGKTTITSKAISILNHLGYKCIGLAFTGRAAGVMKSKGISNARTIHSHIYEPILKMIYDPILKRDVEIIDGYKKRDFVDGDIFFVDEASQLSKDIVEDLISYGIPIVFIGDKEQLPSMDYSKTGFNIMDVPDIHLTEIHRQAENNPIIALSRDIRETGYINYNKFVDNNIIHSVKRRDVKHFIENHKDQLDLIMVGRNKTRQQMNDIFRASKGFTRDEIYHQEQIMCVRNKWLESAKDHIFNGELFNITEILSWSDEIVKVNIANSRISVGRVELKRHSYMEDEQYTYRDPYQFVNGYAATVFKCQGSEFDMPLYYDEDVSWFVDQRKFRYTGITRAKQKLVLIE